MCSDASGGQEEARKGVAGGCELPIADAGN